MAPRTGVGLGFLAGEEREEEGREGRGGKLFVSASSPPSGPPPAALPSSGRAGGDIEEVGKAPARPGVPAPPPHSVRTAHLRPPDAYPGCLLVTSSPGCRERKREPGKFNREQTWLGRLPTRLGAAARLFCTPPGRGFCSRRFLPGSSLSTHCGAGPPCRGEPAAQLQAWISRAGWAAAVPEASASSAPRRRLGRSLGVRAAAASQPRGGAPHPCWEAGRLRRLLRVQGLPAPPGRWRGGTCFGSRLGDLCNPWGGRHGPARK